MKYFSYGMILRSLPVDVLLDSDEKIPLAYQIFLLGFMQLKGRKYLFIKWFFIPILINTYIHFCLLNFINVIFFLLNTHRKLKNIYLFFNYKTKMLAKGVRLTYSFHLLTNGSTIFCI